MNSFERRVLWALFALLVLLGAVQIRLRQRSEVRLRLAPDVVQSS